VWQRPSEVTFDKDGRATVTGNRLGYKRNPSRRELGIEIETNGCTKLGNSRKLWEAIQKWKVAVKPDGSIGGQPAAFELNLMPSCGDVMLTELEEICAGLKDIGATPSVKCGIHVHVNAADIKGHDLKRIIDVYERVERALFDLCAPQRLNNTYSRVCGKLLKSYGTTAEDIRRNMVKSMYNNGTAFTVGAQYKGRRRHEQLKSLGDNLKSNKAGNGCDTRYRALNMASYFKRGTIEFRHFEGMIDFTDISGWAMTVGHLIDACVRMTARQIAVLPTNSRKALLAVLPEWHHAWIIDRWKRMDLLANATYGHQQKRKDTWGI
jgi:hypothetical protein